MNRNNSAVNEHLNSSDLKDQWVGIKKSGKEIYFQRFHLGWDKLTFRTTNHCFSCTPRILVYKGILWVEMVENVFVHKKYAKIIQQYVALCCCSLYWCIVGRRGWSKVYSFPKGTWKYYHCGRLCFFYMIKLCYIRLLYKLKMEDWWPIHPISTPPPHNEDFYSWSSQTLKLLS